MALALLAIGTTGLLTLQLRMRLAADDARQQAHALRLMRNDMEHWRWKPGGISAPLSWEGPDTTYELAPSSTTPEAALGLPPAAPSAGTGNGHTTGAGTATGAATTTDDPDPTLAFRPAHLRVDWTDRTGQRRTISLDSLISTVDPALPGLLLLPPGGHG